jgi:hypothetical protein
METKPHDHLAIHPPSRISNPSIYPPHFPIPLYIPCSTHIPSPSSCPLHFLSQTPHSLSSPSSSSIPLDSATQPCYIIYQGLVGGCVPFAAATSMRGVVAVLNRVPAKVREDHGSQVVSEDRTSTAGIKTVVSGVRLVFGV